MQRMAHARYLAAALVLAATAAYAETGSAGWLRYERITDVTVRQRYDQLSGSVAVLDTSAVVTSARDELVRGIRSLLDRNLAVATTQTGAAIVLGTRDQIRRALPAARIPT